VIAANALATEVRLTVCPSALRGCGTPSKDLCVCSVHIIGSWCVYKYCCFTIKVNLLQGNVLRSTKGIQMLPNLEELDLRHNLIASVHEVVRLSGTNFNLVK
jgi:hypothetical protein